jgi:hypothetical protein
MPAVSAAGQPIAFHVLSSDEDSATRRLHLLMRQRETLRPMFRATWDDLSHHFDATELEAWAGAVLQLANVNAGPACLIAYWDASKGGAALEEIAPLLAAAQVAADICRHAGARAATSALRALPVAARAFGNACRSWPVGRRPSSIRRSMKAGRAARICTSTHGCRSSRCRRSSTISTRRKRPRPTS